jgi:hypothetical protein
MQRRTYSLSATALIAVASLSFSSADGVKAFAQAADSDVSVEQIEVSDDPFDPSTETIETIPLDAEAEAVDAVEFVSEAVVQPLPKEVEPGDATDAASLHELVGMVSPGTLSEQMQCLAGAVYFEARGEPLDGQLAVAQVVINRAEDRRFPASYCGVVHQRAQFSFVKNGRMPRVRTNSGAWERAKAIAKIAHEGLWDTDARDAVYFHASYVRPSWSRRMTRTAQIDTHIFYR